MDVNAVSVPSAVALPTSIDGLAFRDVNALCSAHQSHRG